jgi:hypothetical protein
VLAHFGHRPPPRDLAAVELQTTRPKHRRIIAKADRVIRAYDELDGALQIYIRRAK